MASQRQKRLEKLHSEHEEASRDHAEWQRDLERWRGSYEQALITCARRLASRLELDNFEAALDRHEGAIAAHEEAVCRHEAALALERGPKLGLSEESLEFHRLMGSRHALSRASHEQLDRSHRAILSALEMLGRSS